jgi:hypothetical protein
MRSLEAASLLFSHGPEEAIRALSRAVASGAYVPGSAVTREALNFLMLSLICRKMSGELTLSMLEAAGSKLQQAEVGVGSLVVYRLLLFDLAGEINVKLSLPGDISATGSELDWELLRAFSPVSAVFAKRAEALEAIHAKAMNRTDGS